MKHDETLGAGVLQVELALDQEVEQGIGVIGPAGVYPIGINPNGPDFLDGVTGGIAGFREEEVEVLVGLDSDPGIVAIGSLGRVGWVKGDSGDRICIYLSDSLPPIEEVYGKNEHDGPPCIM